MNSEQAAHETKGVTVKLLETVDLGPEIEGMAGRQLRMGFNLTLVEASLHLAGDV